MLISERFETLNSSADASADHTLETARQQRLIQAMNADQKEKYLHLQEEADLLLHQLKELKRQRQQVEARELVGSAAS
ncbi:MAG: hypothetical protein NW224_15275 [Leptolyngbyaceae cyanobacterium bins.302]|nr:hypothetical protein [Leptolyngbyaceae cyanobacterium bins.302]